MLAKTACNRVLPLVLKVLPLAVLAAPLALAAAQPLSPEAATAVQRELFLGINRVRALAGIGRLQERLDLTRAAQNHADYLAHHGGVAHIEEPNRASFTGQWPADRAVTTGYSSRHVHEVAGAHDSDIEALDTLLSSVYHRMQILSTAINEVGIGIAARTSTRAERDPEIIYVVNFGHSRWRDLCQQRAQPKPENSLIGQCADSEAAIDLGRSQSLQRSLRMASPKVILWPPDQYNSFPVQLANEQPQPLPGRNRIGNAITIQLGLQEGVPNLKSGQLLQIGEDGSLSTVDVDLITPQNDRQRLLKAGEFALVPLYPLRYNTPYEVRMIYDNGGNEYRLEWGFKTEPLPWPVLRLGDRGPIWIESGEALALLLSGRSLSPEADQVSAYSSGSVQVEFEQDWPRPLLARFRGAPCGQAQLRYRNLPETEVRIAPADAENPARQCLKVIADSLPGIRFHGTGEVIKLVRGVEYQLSLTPETERDRIGELRWAAPTNCNVQAKLETYLTARVRIDCRRGQRVRFNLSRERFFVIWML